MSTYEINKELVLSTCHIRHETSLALLSCNATEGDTNAPFGWRIWVGEEVDEQYPDLSALLTLAREHDCLWLVLDRDGSIVDDLQQWSW